MCLLSRVFEPCSHTECHYYYRSITESNLSTETLQRISANLNYQTDLFGQLTASNSDIARLIHSISDSVKQIYQNSAFTANSEFMIVEDCVAETLFRDLSCTQYYKEI